MAQETPIPRAFLYSRVSTPDQAKGYTMTRQIKDAITYAKDKGLEILERPFGDREFTDKGKSAYHAEHIASGQFGLFLKSLPQPYGDGFVRPGDFLLIEDIDRMGRTPPDEAQSIFLNITMSGVIIVTFEQNEPPKVYKKPVNITDLNATLHAMERAHKESVRKAALVKASNNRKQELYNERLIKKGGRERAWLRQIKKPIPGMRFEQTVKYELIPERAKVVTEMYRLCVGGRGNDLIAQELERKGSKFAPFNGRSKRWPLSTIDRYLSDDAVIGYGYPYGELDKNYYPPIPEIVKEKLFDRVRAERGERRRALGRFTKGEMGQKGGGPHINKVNNLFQGLAYCLHCRHMMRYRDKAGTPTKRKRKASIYLTCLNYECPDRPSWNYHMFEATFIRSCRELDLGRMVRTDDQTKAREQLDADIKAIDGRIIDATSRRDGAAASAVLAKNETMRQRFTADADEAQTEIDELEKNKKELEARRDADDNEMNSFHENAEQMDDVLAKLQNRRHVDNPKLRFQASRIISAVVKKIELRGEQPDEAMPEPYYFVTFKNGDVRRIVVDSTGKVISHTFETGDYKRLDQEDRAGQAEYVKPKGASATPPPASATDTSR